MDWNDEGIVLSARPHGESHAVVEIFTPTHGKWAGLLHGGQGRRKSPLLQPGNEVQAEWKGRVVDSLGHYMLELTSPRAAVLMSDRLSLTGLSAACAVASTCLIEREEHAPAYSAMKVLIDNLENIEVWPALMARWELGLLAELGFGLSLDVCVSSGVTEDLIYVSPKSAGAVSAKAGEPYKDKLLALPAFLRDASAAASLSDALAALRTTGYFIETRILHLANRDLPDARRRLETVLAESID